MKFKNVCQFLKNQFLRIENTFLFVFCFCISNFAFATNMLEEVTTDVKDTYTKGVIYIIYAIEGALGTYAISKTRSPTALVATLGVFGLTFLIDKKMKG